MNAPIYISATHRKRISEMAKVRLFLPPELVEIPFNSPVITNRLGKRAFRHARVGVAVSLYRRVSRDHHR